MAVGLDIGSKTVKMVQLSKDGSRFRLKASGIVSHKEKTPEYAEGDNELSSISNIVKKLHKEAKITSKEIAVALPEQQVFTRTIKFPLLTDSEIASAVKWEAEQYIPIPADQAVVKHQIIARNEKVAPPQTTVLLVAAPIALVEKYAKVVEMAGLNLVAVETEHMSLTRSLAPKDQTVLVVDFGARSTDIAISKKGILSFSRSITTAGEAFTRAVAQTLNIDEKRAEEYKRTYGLAGSQLEGKVRTAIRPVFEVVADEIKKAIQFYKIEEKGDVPKSVILAGGSAGMPEVALTLAKLLGIEVVVGNPFTNVIVDSQVQKTLAGYIPLYSVAVGLSMREV
jgi:type IV pilus assembly protein PilM